MKKSLLILASIFVFLLPLITFAAELCEILDNIRQDVWYIFATLVVICFIVAGIMFLTSQGDPTKMQTAKKAFLYAVIGTGVGIMAYSAVSIITKILNVSGAGSGGCTI